MLRRNTRKCYVVGIAVRTFPFGLSLDLNQSNGFAK